jgi:tetratricopeptide (TPR) repeat protein
LPSCRWMAGYGYGDEPFANDDVEPFDDDDDDDDDDGDESDPLASDGEREASREEVEELFGASVETLLAEGKRGPKKRRRPYGAGGAKRRVSEVPPALHGRMGAATVAFMSRQFEAAEELLLKIIQEAPKAVAPYRTLALVCEERGDVEKSLSYLMFAAHLDRMDRDLWKRCASLSYDAGNHEQAIYCLTMALKGTRGQDVEALRARAHVFQSAGQWRKAADNYVKLHKAVPGDLDVVVALAEMLAKDGKQHKAEPHLRAALEYVEQHPLRSDDRERTAAHGRAVATVVQKLIEVQFSQDRYEDAATLLTRMQDRRALGDIQTPFLQRVMLAVCHHRAGSRALASVAFNEFFAAPDAIAANPALMWSVAEACFAGGEHAKTVKAYTALAGHPLYSKLPRLFLRRAEAHMQLGEKRLAEADARHALMLVPQNVEANLFLARLVGPPEQRGGAPADGAAESEGGRAAGRRAAPADGVDGRAVVQTHRPSTGRRRGGESLTSLLQPTGLALLTAAEAAFCKYGADGYAHVLAPVLEAALGLPHGWLRSPNFAGVDVAGNCGEHELTAAAQLVGGDLKALGQAVLRKMSDLSHVVFVERMFDALMCRHAGGEGRNVVEVLVSVRGHRVLNSEPQLKLRLRVLCIASILAHADVDRAYEELRMLSRDFPSDTRVWWLHARFDAYMSAQPDLALRRRMSACLTREAKREFRKADADAAAAAGKRPTEAPKEPSCVGRVMASGVFSVRGVGIATTPRPAIRCFAYVLRRVPQVASGALAVGVNLLNMARSRSAIKRGQLVLKAFSYVDEYRRLRRAEVAKLGAGAVGFAEDEIDYNVGRAMHDVGLLHMAVEMYTKVLDRRRAAGGKLPAWLDVRRDAAFNLAQIFRTCGQRELAAALVREYLAF